jgi:hypothetical protein
MIHLIATTTHYSIGDGLGLIAGAIIIVALLR